MSGRTPRERRISRRSFRVPHVLAAGWGGMGTVSDEEFYQIPVFLRRAEPRRLSRGLDDAPRTSKRIRAFREWKPRQPSLRRSLPCCLNSRIMPPLPTLDELRDIGADAIVAALRALSDKGEPEEALVIALLYLLAESEAGNEFER